MNFLTTLDIIQRFILSFLLIRIENNTFDRTFLLWKSKETKFSCFPEGIILLNSAFKSFRISSFLVGLGDFIIEQEFDLKSRVWFQTKIAWHEVQLPLYYVHLEIILLIAYCIYWHVVSNNILLLHLQFAKTQNWDAFTSHMQNRKGCNLEQKIAQFKNKLRWLSNNFIGYCKSSNLMGCLVFRP